MPLQTRVQHFVCHCRGALTENIDPFPAASKIQVAYRVDAVLARAHTGVQTEIKQVLSLIENAAAATLFDGHPRPFTRSLPTTQTTIIDNWRQSSLHIRRTAFKAISGLCNGVYYANSEKLCSGGIRRSTSAPSRTHSKNLNETR